LLSQDGLRARIAEASTRLQAAATRLNAGASSHLPHVVRLQASRPEWTRANSTLQPSGLSRPPGSTPAERLSPQSLRGGRTPWTTRTHTRGCCSSLRNARGGSPRTWSGARPPRSADPPRGPPFVIGGPRGGLEQVRGGAHCLQGGPP
jgi:hypothetical protein